MATTSAALAWLLEEDQPAVRYMALRDLLDRPEDDPDVRSAKETIPEKGWASEILAKAVGGRWEEKFYVPKYLSWNWMLLVLADLGMTKEDPRIEAACEAWIDRFAREDGGFAMEGSSKSHLCTVGNTARALVKFGYADHPKVRSAFEWLVKSQAKLGGWSCFGSGRNLDSWEPMSAFAVYPKEKWTKGMREAVERAAEFYLQRELHVQGEHYEPWNRFHYPVHYYYDLLVGLDFMTALGYGRDRRLGYALSLLKGKRRKDGRWNLDALHPDVEGAMAEWYEEHPKKKPTPLALERVGEPSKMVTLTAMRVLKRLG